MVTHLNHKDINRENTQNDDIGFMLEGIILNEIITQDASMVKWSTGINKCRQTRGGRGSVISDKIVFLLILMFFRAEK
ncbi:hypothetical protein MTR_2g012460 [Medicago truncatula]|uniref:Uncharacterized protein n=1 Tax=Medicago truncatula TaxID=3880 RepID=G7ILF7_MEDTR|nr:hypothetical protein MTR_2g012460 [Medicago truncatula]